MSGLIGGTPIPAAAAARGAGAPAGIAEAATEAAALAERVATLATAAAQASAIRIPDQPPPYVPPATTPRERLMAFIDSNAVFFANNDDYRNAAGADATIAALRATDPGRRRNWSASSATPTSAAAASRNNTLAQTRADKVAQALVARGVPQRLIAAIGRGQGPDISSLTGPQSPNRRVEFELGFQGEATGQP